jgi:hypothetical protein
MSLRAIAVLVALILQLSACAADKSRTAAIDEMERRHADSVFMLGGGGGSGM